MMRGTDTEKLEAEILRTITLIQRSCSLIGHLNNRMAEYCAKLRNQISAYRFGRSQEEVDDLLFAMIRDDALSIDHMMIAFDLDVVLFEAAIKRMQERDRT